MAASRLSSISRISDECTRTPNLETYCENLSSLSWVLTLITWYKSIDVLRHVSALISCARRVAACAEKEEADTTIQLEDVGARLRTRTDNLHAPQSGDQLRAPLPADEMMVPTIHTMRR